VPTHHVVDLHGGLWLPRLGFGRARLAVSIRNLLDDQHLEVPGGAELGRVASAGLTLDW
jgi:hypothetical protein